MGVTQSFRSEGTVISAVASSWKSVSQRQRAYDDIPEDRRLCPGVGRADGIPVSFFLNRDDTVDLAIVNAEDGVARRTLGADLGLEGDRRHCVLWDTADDAGRPVPPGVYRLRVSLKEADRVAKSFRTGIAARFQVAGESFLTEPGPFSELVAGAVAAETGVVPELSTGGGTSDARFIKDHCPVLELGLVGTSMHQVDEHVEVAHIGQLKAVYGRVLADYFAAGGA